VAPAGQLRLTRVQRGPTVRRVADEFSERYGDLLTGSYDCVDRIVLKAYYPLGHNPGGFRVWWRRLHGGSDELLDNTHLMRMAGRFSRRLPAWAGARGIPVVDCQRGERKHRIAEEYLASHSVGTGVFLILVARAPATVWDVRRSQDVIGNIVKRTAFVNHYSRRRRLRVLCVWPRWRRARRSRWWIGRRGRGCHGCRAAEHRCRRGAWPDCAAGCVD